MSLTKVTYSMIEGTARSVLDFGADPTGVADSGPAFNLALATFGAVVVPVGTYLIKTQIVIPSGAMIFGETGFVPAGVSNGGSKLKYHSDLGATPMVWCQDSTWVSFLSFDGPGKGTGTAILNKKTNPGQLSYEDMDCTIHGCTFDGWDVAVQHWNRGLWFDSNVSALVNNSVVLNIDTANWVDDPGNPFDLPAQGFRAIRFTNNRFHLNTASIVNTGTGREYLRGLSVVGNQIDAGDFLFVGSCNASTFSGNIIDQTDTGSLDFYDAIEDVTVTGNVFGGDAPTPGQGYPLQHIRCRAGATRFTVTGNTFRRTNVYGITFEGAVSKSTITGNTFYSIGNNGTGTNACIRTVDTFDDVSITGNTFFPVVAPFGIRGITTGSWTNVIVDNNVWDTSKVLAAQFLDTGTNYVQGIQVATPAQLTANVADYDPSNASVWRLSSDASREIAGLEFTYKLVGRTLTIINVGTNDIVLKNDGVNANGSSKIITGTGADITLTANKTAQLIKDFTTNRWRVINTN